ncbi:MAG: hypothetical protein ACOCRK_09950 [bacterium]
METTHNAADLKSIYTYKNNKHLVIRLRISDIMFLSLSHKFNIIFISHRKTDNILTAFWRHTYYIGILLLLMFMSPDYEDRD